MPMTSFFRQFKVSRFERGVWVTIFLRFLGMFSFAVYGPFLLLYFSQTRALSTTSAGFLIALNGLASAISQTLGGLITDKLGRKKTIVIISILDIIFSIALTYMIAVSVQVWAIGLIFIVSGFVGGLKQPAISAVIIDLAPKEHLTEAYGLSLIIINIGWVIGPVLGGLLFSSVSFAFLFGVTVFSSIGVFILTLTLLKESFPADKEKQGRQNLFTIKADKPLFIYIGINFLVFIVYVQYNNLFSVFSVDSLGFSVAQYGLLITIASLFAVLFQHPITRMVDLHLGDKNALVLGSILFSAGFFSFSWITDFGWAVAAVLVVALGEQLYVPSASSVVGKLAPPDQRGRYTGLLGTGSMLGVAVGPLLGGFLFDNYAGRAMVMWGVIASITLVAAAGFYTWFRANKGRLK